MRVTNDKRREVAAKVRDVMGELATIELDGIPLADLIEPEPERTCHNKIADINRVTPLEYRTDNFLCSACGEQFFADSEYINYPIDWAFCPNCGARVVEE